MSIPLRVLIVEDSPADAELMAYELKRAGMEFEWRRAENEAEYLEALDAHPDIILADHNLPQFDAERALTILQARALDIPFIIVSGAISEETAVARMKQGAADYLLKDRIARLAPAVLNALEQKKARAERSEAFQQMRESEARKSAILEAAIDAIISIDHQGKILDFNPAAEKMFGILRFEACGKSVAELIIPVAMREAHRQGLSEYLTTGESTILRKRIETTALRANGDEFPIELVVFPVRSDDAPPRFTAFIHDVAERKERERIQQRYTELEAQNRRIQEANRLKSEFLANMSHELRTPLNAIIGFAELMHDGKVGPPAPRHQEFLGDILSSARHLLQLINDILDLSKVESGRMDLKSERVDAERVVTEVCEIVRSLAAKARIRLHTEIDPSVRIVETDPRALKQILYNYLSNAIKFTPEEGKVSVRISREDPEHFRIEVEDTGIGIKSEDLGRLFVEFQQLDASAGKKYPGTGLGLALTKRIVEAQNGSVGVISTPGKGSVFHAVLPILAAAVSSVKTVSDEKAADPKHARILVIEDDPGDRSSIEKALTDAGYGVETVATGAEALMRCRAKRFDAITLDVLLPDMAGRAVLEKIRERSLNRQTPVIVVTVLAHKGIVAGFPVVDVLAKPVSADCLLKTLVQCGVNPKDPQPILIVDDDESSLKLADKTLKQLGYYPICKQDAQSALKAAHKQRPAAVVVDLMMPEIDGFEFLRRFRRSKNGRRTPVIVWTGKDLSEEERSMLKSAAHSVVPKRVRIDELIQEVKGCVHGSQ